MSYEIYYICFIYYGTKMQIHPETVYDIVTYIQC
jgi:hypothetical protein